MSEITRIVTNGRRGRAVVYNGVIYLGGQAAEDRSQGIEGQTRQVLAKIDKVLAEAGSDKSRLLSVQIWLKDIAADFSGMNIEWDSWIDPKSAPARATCQCTMGADDVLVEIVAMAAVGY